MAGIGCPARAFAECSVASVSKNWYTTNAATCSYEGMMKRTLAMLPLVIFLACACGDRTTRTETAAGSTATAETAAVQPTETVVSTTTETAKEEKPMSEYTSKVAELNTSKGKIVVRFHSDLAPNHVRNFVELSESGFYNGTRFHRVIPGFMIQGGDPNTKTDNSSSWGTGGSGTNVKAEFSSKSHKRGILSMARAQDPNSASSQFFIVVADSTFLDNQYTVFGEVLSGMEVADAIVAAPRRGEQPVEPVKIESISIREATDTEKAPATSK